MIHQQGLYKVKQAPLALITAVVLAHLGFTLFANLVAFRNGLFDGIYAITNGWVNGTLTANLIGLLLEVCVLFILVGRLTLRDLGIRKEDLAGGAVGTLLFWLAINAIILLVALLTRPNITFNEELIAAPNLVLGNFIGQVFGNALLEEIVFRGFLLIQVYLLLARAGSGRRRIIIAIVISQVIFALIHIPNRIYAGLVGAQFVIDFIELVIFGAVFAILYLQTKNLFFVIGIHSLVNAPPVIIESSFASAAVLCILLFICLKPFFRTKKQSSGLEG